MKVWSLWQCEGVSRYAPGLFPEAASDAHSFPHTPRTDWGKNRGRGAYIR